LTEQEENYPGYTGLSGPKLMDIFYSQAEKFGAQFVAGKATKLEKLNGEFKVTLSNGEEYITKSVILAYGKIPRPLGVPGEDKFIGRGVHTCATCDAPFMKGRTVAVAGGGNSAFEAAELLSKFGKKVYLIHRRDEFRADPITVDKVKATENVEVIVNTEIREIKGDEKVTSLLIESKDGTKRELPLDALFVEIGHILDTAWVKDLVKTNAEGEIVTNKSCETSVPGIFAAGDVTDSPYKQTVTAAGEGAVAALSAYNYFRKLEGKPAVKVDWS
jgi:thioredoxin reductase (NADPH)